MRIIGLVHTYYMLMTLMQLRLSVFQDDEFDIIMTDASSNSKDVFDKLNKTYVFDTCYYLHSSKCYIKREAGIIQKLVRVIQNVINPQGSIEDGGLIIDDYNYDIMFGYVINRHDEQVVFQQIKKNNASAVYATYEESFVSYCSVNGIFASKGIVRSDLWLGLVMRALGKRKLLISNNLNSEWFFDKTLVQYKGFAEFRDIPKFESKNEEMRNALNTIFGIDNDVAIPSRFIFLEDSAYLSGENTDDMEFIELISEIVGKENIAVKLHPRTIDNRFEDKGYYTIMNSAPLEALIINGVIDADTVFITMASSGPLSCIVDFDLDFKVIMLYKCSSFPLKVVKNKNFEGYIESVQKKYGTLNLFIPEHKSALVEYIRDLL